MRFVFHNCDQAYSGIPAFALVGITSSLQCSLQLHQHHEIGDHSSQHLEKLIFETNCIQLTLGGRYPVNSITMGLVL